MVGAAEWDAALANAASRLAQGDAASLGQSYPADATLEELSHDLFADAAMAEMRGVVTCGVCGRLWVQAEPGADEYLCYQRCEDRR